MSRVWEDELAAFLGDLTAVQEELLQFLAQKRASLVSGDAEQVASLQAREERLLTTLQECHDRRGRLLVDAAAEGRMATNLRELAGTLPPDSRDRLTQPLQVAVGHARLLQHQSLANWVVVQRTLLHLAQILEILATGGRPRPTYGREAREPAGGSLVDQAV